MNDVSPFVDCSLFNNIEPGNPEDEGEIGAGDQDLSLLSIAKRVCPDEGTLERFKEGFRNWPDRDHQHVLAHVLDLVRLLVKKYLPRESELEGTMRARAILGAPLSNRPLIPDELTAYRNTAKGIFVCLYEEASRVKATLGTSREFGEFATLVDRFSAAVTSAYNLLLQDVYVATLSNGSAKPMNDKRDLSTSLALWDSHLSSGLRMKPFQQFLHGILVLCAQRGLRYNGDFIYSRMVIRRGRDVFAAPVFNALDKIDVWLAKQCQHEGNFALWNQMVEKGYKERVVAHLRQSQEIQLPQLIPDVQVTAWKNGIFYSDSRSFVPYEDSGLSGVRVSGIYHDVDFPTYRYDSFADLLSKSRSPFIKILKDQGYTTVDEIRAICAVLGRVLHPKDKYEKWQIFPFLMGAGGTGKGTICRALRALLPRSMTAIVTASTYETTFGMDPLHDKQFIYCADICTGSKFPTEILRNITGGDAVQIGVKHEKGFTKDVLPFFIAVGNAWPSTWIDVKGNLSRRAVVINLLRTVLMQDSVDSDMMLYLGDFMLLLTVGFFEFLEMSRGQANVWQIIPESIRRCGDAIKSASSNIARYLQRAIKELVPADAKYDPTMQRGVTEHQLIQGYKTFLSFSPDYQSEASKINQDTLRLNVLNEMHTLFRKGIASRTVSEPGKPDYLMFPNVELSQPAAPPAQPRRAGEKQSRGSRDEEDEEPRVRTRGKKARTQVHRPDLGLGGEEEGLD